MGTVRGESSRLVHPLEEFHKELIIVQAGKEKIASGLLMQRSGPQIEQPVAGTGGQLFEAAIGAGVGTTTGRSPGAHPQTEVIKPGKEVHRLSEI